MVSAIVQLTTTLGLTPLAEGVETLEQAQILAELGCPLAQGYFFGRPAPQDPPPQRATTSERTSRI